MDITLNQKQIFIKLFDTIVKYKTPDGRLLTEDLIKIQTNNSISLLDVSNKIQNNLYLSLESFVEDINNFFKNTLKIFQIGSEQYDDCKSLLDTFMTELQNMQNEFINIQKELKCTSKYISDTSSDAIEYDRIIDLIEHLINYQDSVSRQFIFEIFKIAPSRIQYPDYYDVIKEPIDLNTIHKKAKKQKYSTLPTLCSDLALLVKNAKTYNEPGSWIYKLANQFKKVYIAKKSQLEEEKQNQEKIAERTKGIKRALRSSDPTTTSTTTLSEDEEEDTDNYNVEQSFMSTSANAVYFQIYDEVLQLKDPNLPTGYMNMNVTGTVRLSDPFYRLPSSYHYPDYYQEITKPIALSQIKIKIQKNQYENIEEFMEDMFLMFNNAMVYNIPQSKIYKDAKYFKDYLRKRIQELNINLSNHFYNEQDKTENQLSQDAQEVVGKSGVESKTADQSSSYKPEDIDEDTLSGDASFNTNISTATPSKRGRGRPPRSSGAPSHPYSQPNKKRQEDTLDGEYISLRQYNQNQGNLLQSNAIQENNININNNVNVNSQAKSNEFVLMNRLIEVFKEIVSLTDEKGYKIALFFIKKPNNLPNFLDLTDIEHALSEGKFHSTAKLIEETSRVISNYKELVYGPAFNSLINSGTPIHEGTPNAQLRDAYNACTLMINYMTVNPRFKDMMAEEETRALLRQKNEQNRLMRLRLQNIYNELLNLQDKSTKRILSGPFVKLPSKQEYPDYYQIIQNPIDLSSINCKIIYNNMAYQSFHEFFVDTDLMLSNSFIFNDPESVIYKDALLLYKFLCEKRTELSEEVEGKPNVQLRVKAIFTNIYVGLITFKDSNGAFYSDALQDIMQSFSEKLHDLPNQYFPSYFNNNPMSFETIKRYLDGSHYTRLDVFQEHILYSLKKVLYYSLMKPSANFDDIKQEPLEELAHTASNTGIMSKSTDPVLASIELLKRYFVLRDKHCLRTLKVVNNENESTATNQHLKYYILRSYMAFDERDIENSLNYLTNQFPRNLKKFIEDSRNASSKNNANLDGDDCGTEETNSNSNDVNSSFGDWKRGSVDEPMEGYEVNGKTYFVGDFVYLEPNDKGVPDPHIMAVQQFTRDPDSGILYVQGCWFYRPYETFHPSTRKFYQQEVFKSDYYDKVFASKIIGKCIVLLHRDYVKYKVQDFEPKDVYVCESRYFTRQKNFKRIKHWNHLTPFTETYYNPNRITFIQRETTLNMAKNVPSVFADKSYAQFIEDNSYVPHFPHPTSNQLEITLKRGDEDYQLQKIRWINFKNAVPSTNNNNNIGQLDNSFGINILIGDYIEIQKIHSNLKPYVMLVQGIYKTIPNVPSVSGQARAIYTIYGPRKFVYDLDPFIPDGANFQKNAKDLFLLPLPNVLGAINSYSDNNTPAGMSSATTELYQQRDNDPNSFLETHYPDYITNDVETFTVTKKLYVLGAETFSKKWPTEIEEKDLYVCRYRLSIAINNMGSSGTGQQASQQLNQLNNQPFINRFIIAPLVYENYCNEFPLPTPSDMRLIMEWYHFDNNELYESPNYHIPISVTSNNGNNQSISSQHHRNTLLGGTQDTNNPTYLVAGREQALSSHISGNNHFLISNVASSCNSNNNNNSALTSLLSQKPTLSTTTSGSQYGTYPSNPMGQMSLTQASIQTIPVSQQPSMAEVFFGSDSIDSAPNNQGLHLSPTKLPSLNNSTTKMTKIETKTSTSTSIRTIHSTPTKLSSGLGGTCSGGLREIHINDYKLIMDDDDYKFIQKKAKPSGYIIYAGERRQPLMDKNPALKFGEISKIIGLEWKQMSQEEKIRYDQKAIKFGEELRSYIGDCGGSDLSYTPSNFSSTILATPSSSTPSSSFAILTAASNQSTPIIKDSPSTFGSRDSSGGGTPAVTPSVNDKERVAKYLQKLIKKSQQVKQRNSLTSVISAAGTTHQVPPSSTSSLIPHSHNTLPSAAIVASSIQEYQQFQQSHYLHNYPNPNQPQPQSQSLNMGSTGGYHVMQYQMLNQGLYNQQQQQQPLASGSISRHQINNERSNVYGFLPSQHQQQQCQQQQHSNPYLLGAGGVNNNNNNNNNLMMEQRFGIKQSPSSIPPSNLYISGRGPLEYKGGGIYACMWGDCDYQFEDVQDLIDHVTLQTDHIKATDGEYTCNWANCWKASKDKDPKPFLTQGRLIRHLRESHFRNSFIKNVALEHISRNYITSSKRVLESGTNIVRVPNNANNAKINTQHPIMEQHDQPPDNIYQQQLQQPNSNILQQQQQVMSSIYHQQQQQQQVQQYSTMPRFGISGSLQPGSSSYLNNNTSGNIALAGNNINPRYHLHGIPGGGSTLLNKSSFIPEAGVLPGLLQQQQQLLLQQVQTGGISSSTINRVMGGTTPPSMIRTSSLLNTSSHPSGNMMGASIGLPPFSITPPLIGGQAKPQQQYTLAAATALYNEQMARRLRHDLEGGEDGYGHHVIKVSTPRPMFVIPPASYTRQLNHSQTFIKYLERTARNNSTTNIATHDYHQLEDSTAIREIPGPAIGQPLTSSTAVNQLIDDSSQLDILDSNPTLKELVKVDCIDDYEKYSTLLQMTQGTPERDSLSTIITKEENEMAIKKAQFKALTVLKEKLFEESIRMDNWIYGKAC